MPLPDPASVRARTIALLAGSWLALTWAQAPAAADIEQPTEPETQRALAIVKADPNLATEGTRRVPTFGDAERKHQPPRPLTTAVRNLFEWLGATSRALLWVLGAIFGTLLVLGLVRLLRYPGMRRSPAVIPPPTHVRDLDIRPESLPEQIGAAALQLWERNEQRAALALLYRGLLSRLVHVHALPIRDSTTEAGCSQLAHEHLPAELTAYVLQLIRGWQRAVYGGMHPDTREFQALCTGFDTALPSVRAPQSTP